MKVVGQKGLENFENESYFEETGDKPWDWSVRAMAPRGEGLFINQTVGYLTSFTEEPDLFHDFRKSFEEAIINQDDYSKADLNKMYKIYQQVFYTAIKKQHENNKEDQRILKNNTDYLKTFQFFTSTTRLGSFYDKVQKPLNEGASIETIGIPFLTEQYKKYNTELSEEEKQNTSFETYIVHSGKSIVNVDKESNPVVTVPFQSNSFALKIIEKYNQNKDEIEELSNLEKNKGELNFLELVDRRRKLDQNETFLNMIKKVWFQEVI